MSIMERIFRSVYFFSLWEMDSRIIPEQFERLQDNFLLNNSAITRLGISKPNLISTVFTQFIYFRSQIVFILTKKFHSTGDNGNGYNHSPQYTTFFLHIAPKTVYCTQRGRRLIKESGGRKRRICGDR